MFILVFHAYVYMHVHVHYVYMHVHVHMFRDTPMLPDAPNPSAPSPEPQGAAGSPNHWKFISPELIKIIQFCLKNLYLWTFLNSSRLTLITLDTPPTCSTPWSQRSRNLKNSIKHEQIEIIEFCLKICDPWALLHTYRPDFMCRWGEGVFGPKWHFYVLSPKKYMFFTPTTP